MKAAIVFFLAKEKTVQQSENSGQHAGEEQNPAADEKFENGHQFADIAAFDGYHAAVKGQEAGVGQE